MLSRKWLSQLGIAITCFLYTIGFSTGSSLAQRSPADLTAYLLDAADCIVSGSNSSYSRLYDEISTTAIDRQVYDRLFSISSYFNGGNTTITCRADSEEFRTVDLQMGVSDNSAQYGSNMTINIYQGGHLKHTYNDVQSGTMINALLDLDDPQVPRNANSFAVEIFNCQGRRQCYLQFVEARLHPNGNVTTFPSNEVMPESLEGPQNSGSLVERTTTEQIGRPQTNSSRQDTSPVEPASSRRDSNPTSGIITNVVERLIDELFK